MMTEALPPSPKAFTNAMRALVGHCSVLTVGTGDDISGLVVTSAISLSADPPLLLACVNRASSSWPLLEKYRRFGWSSLGAQHQPVAQFRPPQHVPEFGQAAPQDHADKAEDQ